MAILPQIKNPDTYQACQWNLLENDTRRDYWLKLFRTHFVSLLEHAEEEAADRQAPRPPIEEARRVFFAWLDRAGQSPCPFSRLDVITICYERERVLNDLSFGDPYRLAKHQQNEQCLKVLPALLEELDALPPSERDTAIVKGVFAGNIFDLGAPETIALFAEGDVHFDQVRARLKPRPWLVDGLDTWLQTLATKTHKLAVLFVDNAGPDICLGMIPFARYLLARGTRVVLTANTDPSLNDVTIDELTNLIKRVADIDPAIDCALQNGDLQLIASGNNAPLIELDRVGDELADLCNKESVDLVVLEGMGRSIESNYHATFTCDALKIAMLKDVGVAEELGGESFDLVFKFEPA